MNIKAKRTRQRSFPTDICVFEPAGKGFEVKWIMSSELLRMSVNDDILEDWLDNPVTYGAFENGRMIGFVDGFLEKWNNRYWISNICVFDSTDRKRGLGSKQMETILGKP